MGYEIYGRLKTHDLELQQRKDRKSRKAKYVALKAEMKPVKSIHSNSSKGKGRYIEIGSDESKIKTNVNSDTDFNEDSTDSEMKEMGAMLVKSFKKFKSRKFIKQGNTSRQVSNSDKKERYNKKPGKYFRSGTIDKSKVKCYNYDVMGYFAADCRKVKVIKSRGKAIITSQKKWDDSSDSDRGINYALMDNTEADSENSDKVLEVVYDFDTENFPKLKSFLKSLHISFKSQSLENSRIKSKMKDLSIRNKHFEAKLLFMTQVKKECDDARNMKIR